MIADQALERVVLGAVMLGDYYTADEVWALLGPGDFTGAHVDLAVVLRERHDQHEPVDPLAVWQAIRARGIRGVPAPALHSMVESVPVAVAAKHYATELHKITMRRRLVRLADRIGQAAENPEVDPAAVAGMAVDEAEAVREGVIAADAAEPDDTVEQILTESHEYEWVAPRLLERRDRLILTGEEGLGKSHLLRQLAVSLAAGLDPFGVATFRPVRVLIVDCENSRRHFARKVRPIVDAAGRRGRPVDDRLRAGFETAGLDLLRPEDQTSLYRRIEAARPDVLITGPLYKMHTGSPNDEESARIVADVFDRARARYNVAVILEAHAGQDVGGQRSLRPIGSSLWRRWPEFGYGLRKTLDGGICDLAAWRGPRDERAFPERVMHGGPAGWPWVEAPPDENSPRRGGRAAALT